MRSRKIFLLLLLFALGGGGCFSPKPLNQAFSRDETVKGMKIVAMPDRLVGISLKQLRVIGFSSDTQGEWELRFRGFRIPFWIIGDQEQKLVFYSPPTRSPYWSENVFILQPQSSENPPPDPELAEMIRQIDLPQGAFDLPRQGSVLGYIALEKNLLYQSKSEREHWYWQRLINNQGLEILLNLADLPQEMVFLRLWIYSETEAPPQPDHALKVRINDVFDQEVRWDGKGWQTVELSVSGGTFRMGENRIFLSVADLEGVFAQVSYLDRVEVFIEQKPPLKAAQMEFFAFEPIGFLAAEGNNPPYQIWEIEDPLNPKKIAMEDSPASSTELKHYIGASENGFQAPKSLEPIGTIGRSSLEETAIDYLVIGAGDLLKPLQPLINLHEQEGLRVKVVDVEEISRQFYGFQEPQAVRAYLAELAHQSASLKYVLLVGDTTYDPAQSVSPPQLNRLPTFFIDTIFGGQTSSELPFAIPLNEKNAMLETQSAFQPQLAVGRLPASSPEQVQQWVSKVLEYEQGNMKPHTKAILAIADPQEGSFSRDAGSFLDLWGGAMNTELFLPQIEQSDLPQKMEGYFQQDYQMIAYFGHGAIDLWGKDEIFTSKEAAALSGQASYPVVLNFTCLTGYYIHPEVMSLSEALLWNPKGGAILVIAPTSLTLADDQSFLWRSFVESYRSAENGRIGDVWLATISKINLTGEGIRDVVATYTLFGDPALSLP